MGPLNGAIGLDIGATKTLGVLVDEQGRVVEQVREATEPGPDGVVRTAELVVAHLGAAADGPRAVSVGLGIPGLVDVERGVVKHAVNLGLDGAWVPLRDELERRLGLPVAIENDVNVATLGAVALSGIRDLVYLSIGTGLAAGLVLDGQLRRGASGAAGEVGHVPVDPDRRPVPVRPARLSRDRGLRARARSGLAVGRAASGPVAVRRGRRRRRPRHRGAGPVRGRGGRRGADPLPVGRPGHDRARRRRGPAGGAPGRGGGGRPARTGGVVAVPCLARPGQPAPGGAGRPAGRRDRAALLGRA